jgi:hypothetical protein
MHCSDSQTGSLAASVVEVQCSLVHPKDIVDEEPDWLWRPSGIMNYRRLIVRPTRRSDTECPDIFRFVEIASTRNRMFFAVKMSEAGSVESNAK